MYSIFSVTVIAGIPLTTVSDVRPPEQEQLTTVAGAGEQTQMWSKAAIHQLLLQVKERYSRRTDKITKNKFVWKEVAAAMQTYILGVTEIQCDQKWQNLKLHWKKYVDHQKKTGRRRKSKSDFYEEIMEIVGSSHTVNPPHTLQTTTLAPAATDEPPTLPSAEWSQTSSIAGDQPPSVVSSEPGPSHQSN